MADTMKRARPGKPAIGKKAGGRRSGRRTAREMALRRKVIETAVTMSRIGLSPGRSGNVSCRFGEGMVITPSGMAYETLKADDVVFVDGDGTVPGGQRRPSSEWRFHLSAYRARPDRDAVVHTHSLHATVLAAARRPIPAFHYMVAVAGGNDIPCVDYATFGTEELAELVAAGLARRDACLMANHGQIAIGRDLDAALELAREVEALADQFVKVLSITSRPPLLDDDEMQDVLERFKGYGQNAQS